MYVYIYIYIYIVCVYLYRYDMCQWYTFNYVQNLRICLMG